MPDLAVECYIGDGCPFCLYLRLGGRIIETTTIPRPVVYLHEHDIALVSFDLRRDLNRARRAGDWLLTQALARHSR